MTEIRKNIYTLTDEIDAKNLVLQTIELLVEQNSMLREETANFLRVTRKGTVNVVVLEDLQEEILADKLDVAEV